MRLRIISIICLVIMYTNTGNLSAQTSTEKIPLIPEPVNTQLNEGHFNISDSTSININDDKLTSDVGVFNNYLNTKYGFKLSIKKSVLMEKQKINIFLFPGKEEEGYQLIVDTSEIIINASTSAGAFYALQTLKELLPPVYLKGLSVQCLKIDDAPRFKYRGMHLDVSRHFFPSPVVKKYIDYLALYKMNVFHWHLTDDQGWRIEIKKYPKLQKIGAWRNGTLIGHYGDQPERYDSLMYGGFYTQEEIKDIVRYAMARHITIIPEIEMPGHAVAALAAYPEYSCTGGPFETGKTWGVYKDVFCPKEETFHFLENILDEVCGLFPGKYIHIGGDECPKDRWKECEYCQQLIKKENLGDENGLQRYFTNRIAAYLKTKNKTAIGWDEILEKNLDKDAVIMSWRGYEGGTVAAQEGHDVVMSPESRCYFDKYQTRNTDGRIAIGGYLPLDMVYSFEPVPDVLNSSQAKHIIGAQGNVWTEYITDEARLEEMIFPRICALSEVLWSPKEKRDYNDFTSRLIPHFNLLDFMKVGYSTALFDVFSKVTPNGDNGINISLYSNYGKGKIYYTFSGKNPDVNSRLYTDKIPVDQDIILRAALFENGRQRSGVYSHTFYINKATGKEIILANKPHEEYNRGGAMSLVDGATGSLPWIPSEWLGFSGKDLDATIDLGKTTALTRVYVDVLKDEEGKIFLPSEISVSLSDDGKFFNPVAKIDSSEINKMDRRMTLKFPRAEARWIKVIAKNYNEKDWLFVDEIGAE